MDILFNLEKEVNININDLYDGEIFVDEIKPNFAFIKTGDVCVVTKRVDKEDFNGKETILTAQYLNNYGNSKFVMKFNSDSKEPVKLKDIIHLDEDLEKKILKLNNKNIETELNRKSFSIDDMLFELTVTNYDDLDDINRILHKELKDNNNSKFKPLLKLFNNLYSDPDLQEKIVLYNATGGMIYYHIKYIIKTEYELRKNKWIPIKETPYIKTTSINGKEENIHFI